MRYFGLFSSEEATIRGSNLLDTLCGQLEKLLSFQPGERDLVMLQHKFVVEWEDGKKVSDSVCWMSLSEVPAPNSGSRLTSWLEMFGTDRAGLLAYSNLSRSFLSSINHRD